LQGGRFVAGPRTTARASLIDRLVDLNPKSQWEEQPFRTLSREELRESVRRDLEWLLNTRTSFPGSPLDKKDLTVIYYGIPDFGSYSPANPDHQELLAKRITRSISAFEPRLKNVRVIVEPEMPNEKTLRIHIDAVLVVESLREPVSFQTVLQGQTGTLEIHERT
jgi:type VI secretion system protein ImpF